MYRALADLAPLWDLRPTERGFEAETFYTPHGSILGAHQLLQQVFVAERSAAGKRVLSLQTLFSRGGRGGEPVEIIVDVLQQGRSFSSLRLTTVQDGTTIGEAVVLLTADEPDYLRHQAPAPEPEPEQVPDWPEAKPGFWPGRAWQDETVGPGGYRARFDLTELDLEPRLGRGLVAMCSEAPVMSAALELVEIPWQIGGRATSNVLTHAVHFLEPIASQEHLIVDSLLRYAGRGRAHGQGQVTDEQGRLLATFTTTGLLRRPRGSDGR